jgi:hypothetical protein
VDAVVDAVCEFEYYSKMREYLLLDLMEELDDDSLAVPVGRGTAPPSSGRELLWEVVATPDMMRAFGATVAAQG